MLISLHPNVLQGPLFDVNALDEFYLSDDLWADLDLPEASPVQNGEWRKLVVACGGCILDTVKVIGMSKPKAKQSFVCGTCFHIR